MSKPRKQEREIYVEFVESENITDFDLLAKAIAGAIRKEIDKDETDANGKEVC